MALCALIVRLSAPMPIAGVVWSRLPCGTDTNESAPEAIRSKRRSPVVSCRSSSCPALADRSWPPIETWSGLCNEPECEAAMSPAPARRVRSPPVMICGDEDEVLDWSMFCAVMRLASVPALTWPRFRLGSVLWTNTVPVSDVASN